MVGEDYELPAVDIWQEVSNAGLNAQQLSSKNRPSLLWFVQVLTIEPDRSPGPALELLQDPAHRRVARVAA